MELISGPIKLSSSTWRDSPMTFSQLSIRDVRVMANGPDLFITWTSSSDPGMVFQVYVDRRLVWSGTVCRCHVPTPAHAVGRNVWVEVGTVAAADPTRDYSASLAASLGRTERATLNWSGGTYLDSTGRDDISAFQIYQSAAAGLPVDDSVAVDTVVAYPGGWINDGFGKGGWGEAGFGRAATTYQWRSGPLTSGIWQYAVVAVDRAGNPRGESLRASVTIQAAPRPPTLDAQGSRLTSKSSGPDNLQLTLQWLSSPTR